MKYPVTTEVTVYFSDCDPMGHCNNARFFTFMEQARVEYLKKVPDLNLTVSSRRMPDFILAEASCTFKSPAYLDEKIVVQIRISEIRTRSFLMEYEMRERKTKRLIAVARSAQVMFHYKTHKTFPIPLELRRAVDKIERRKFPKP